MVAIYPIEERICLKIEPLLRNRLPTGGNPVFSARRIGRSPELQQPRAAGQQLRRCRSGDVSTCVSVQIKTDVGRTSALVNKSSYGQVPFAVITAFKIWSHISTSMEKRARRCWGFPNQTFRQCYRLECKTRFLTKLLNDSGLRGLLHYPTCRVQP